MNRRTALVVSAGLSCVVVGGAVAAAAVSQTGLLGFGHRPAARTAPASAQTVEPAPPLTTMATPVSIPDPRVRVQVIEERVVVTTGQSEVAQAAIDAALAQRAASSQDPAQTPIATSGAGAASTRHPSTHPTETTTGRVRNGDRKSTRLNSSHT